MGLKNNLALKPLGKYKLKVILGPALKLFEVASELLVPFLVRFIIDNGIANNDFYYTIKLSLIMFSISILGFIITMIAQYLASRVSADYGYDIKKEIYQKINKLDETSLNKYGKQKILTLINNDSFNMQNGVMMFMRLLLRPPFLILGAAILSFTIDYRAGLIFVGVIILSSLLIYLVTKFVNKKYIDIQSSLDDINKLSSESLSGIRVIHSFKKEKDTLNRFNNVNNNYKKHSLDVAKMNSLINPLTFFFVNMGVVLVVYLGNIGVNDGFMTTGQIVSLISYLVTTLHALTMFSRMIISLNKATISMKRINDFLSLTDSKEYNDSSKEINMNESSPILEFKDVSFSYNGVKNNINNISFKVNKGETIGIIGGTGSGKSTLVALINRIYEVNDGEILIKGVNINDISNETLRNTISTVFQKHSIFKGTIKSNIVLDNSFDEDRFNLAINNALASEYINKFEDKYDHKIEENGSNLSGGQKQRLLIARALYNLKDILILDDSTSALDYISDKKVRENINNYKDLTKIIISQRATTLMNADRIIVLDKGNIISIGNHDELMKSSELYRSIYNIQKGVN